MSVPNEIRWRCRRGLLEVDIILSGFLERGYSYLTPEECDLFDLLLEEGDPTLLAWFMGFEIPADQRMVDLVSRIAAC